MLAAMVTGILSCLEMVLAFTLIMVGKYISPYLLRQHSAFLTFVNVKWSAHKNSIIYLNRLNDCKIDDTHDN